MPGRDAELAACLDASRKMELRYGHWFDNVFVPVSLESALDYLLNLATRLEREPQWIPRHYFKVVSQMAAARVTR
ncbi:unnamed protein product [Protopolystoma xenopodis]|uniref:Guanylate kinase-like domain-containing protein n=1 Tax=Protopolystoma xenopodis TaxID=117903 RepID=A0A448WFY3_9PLAT|nr:unnamed protein product [Protopolystoma xenopodis]